MSTPDAMPITTESATLLESFKALGAADQAAFLQQATAAHLKTVRQELKQKPKRLTPEERAAKPKREQPESVKAWINYVKAIQAELGCKYGEAMAEASKRRAAGDPAAPVAAAKPAKKDSASVLSKEEKASIRSAAKEAKQAAAAEAKEAKQAAKAADKAAKEQEKAAEKAAKEAAKAAEKAAKEAAKQATAAAKAAAKATPATKKAAAPAPAPAPVEAEEEALTEFTHAGKTYWKSGANECWLKGADGALGAWAGIFRNGKMDASAPEPQLA